MACGGRGEDRTGAWRRRGSGGGMCCGERGGEGSPSSASHGSSGAGGGEEKGGSIYYICRQSRDRHIVHPPPIFGYTALFLSENPPTKPASSPVFHGFLGVLEGGVCSVSHFQPWGDITNGATARSTTILRIWRRCAISRRPDLSPRCTPTRHYHRCLHARHPLL